MYEAIEPVFAGACDVHLGDTYGVHMYRENCGCEYRRNADEAVIDVLVAGNLGYRGNRHYECACGKTACCESRFLKEYECRSVSYLR